MGQSDMPKSGVPDSQNTSPGRTRLPSLRQALNALMMSDERREEGQPGDITLGMEISLPAGVHEISDSSKPTRSATQKSEGVRKMSASANIENQPVMSDEPKRIGRRGAAPVTLEAEQVVAADAAKKTQMVRGQQEIQRSGFHQEPVVGWLVVIGGPGLGAYRPVFEGNNTLGRHSSQRIPIDFGDESISGEEQVYVRYDSSDKSFLLVPNLTKTNVVAVNDEKPTNAVKLQAMDVITIGRTQLVFVPFCGDEFDWSELRKIQK